MDNKFIAVPINTELFREVLLFLDSEGVERDPCSVVEQFVRYGLDNASWKKEVFFPELVAKTPPAELKGYVWGDVFLPHGTLIRMRYKRQFYYAKVDGDQVVYEGMQTSPSGFANTVTKSSRNAWRDLWIRKPGDQDWIFADDLRNETKKK